MSGDSPDWPNNVDGDCRIFSRHPDRFRPKDGPTLGPEIVLAGPAKITFLSNFNNLLYLFPIAMVQTPAAIQKLFLHFPLVEHPPIPNSTPKSKSAIEKDTYFFSGNSKDFQGSFILGVYNVIEADFNGNSKFICSDPVSFGQALILCDKNGLKLPTLAATNESSHALLRLSHHAAANNQLPVLIETSKELSRNIKSSELTNSIISTKSLKSTDKLVNDLVDIELYDVWVLALLADVVKNDTKVFLKLFAVDENIASSSLYHMTLISELQHLVHCNSFKTRHPSLFEDSQISKIQLPSRIYSEGVVEAFTVNNSKAIGKAYNDALARLEDTLEVLIDFANNNPNSKIIKFKLIAFVVAVLEVLPATRLGEVVAKYEVFKKTAYSVISSSF